MASEGIATANNSWPQQWLKAAKKQHNNLFNFNSLIYNSAANATAAGRPYSILRYSIP
jgi:hypothetical protein